MMLFSFIFFIAACNDEGIIIVDDYVVKKDTTQNQSLVGEWYEVGYTENMGVKVVFTETNLTAYTYYGHKVYDNLIYYILNDDEMQIDNFTESSNDGSQILIHPKHITKYAFSPDNDTLFIKHFITTIKAVLYPNNLNSIYLVRGDNE